MIISASRRTDIPAYFAEGFMKSVRARYSDVPHPFNSKKVYRVDLRPEAVDAVVFWTRDPEPLMPHLDELNRLGYRYYFLFTLIDYPARFEPGLRPLEERIETFRRLAERIGPGRLLWRYDPILVTTITDLDFHLRSFARLADELQGATRRVIVSFYDAYRSTERRLSTLGELGIRHFPREKLFGPAGWMEPEGRGASQSNSGGGEVPKEHTRDFLRRLSRAARERAMRPTSCAEPISFESYGIEAAPCIDPELIERELGARVSRAKDPGQRGECLCVKSRDIGVYGTCPAGCIYCYAQR